jgi:hypothetical protein
LKWGKGQLSSFVDNQVVTLDEDAALPASEAPKPPPEKQAAVPSKAKVTGGWG